MDVRFHCEKRVRRSGKKSKHGVMATCPTVMQVLRLNPHYGVSIPRHDGLLKMRLQVPGLNAGKSGGYRLIYSVREMDEALHVVFLETWFKGEKEDLSAGEYEDLERAAASVFAQPTLHDWE
jgi:mRNA-degrading endonuclease RelE of RelBE toxin-antitoxin system